MPTLVLSDVPQTMLDDLSQRAEAAGRSLPSVTLELLGLALRSSATDGPPRWPEYLPHEEQSVYVDLPFSTPGVPVGAVPGSARLPDLTDLAQVDQ